jgi:hypothetical protein
MKATTSHRRIRKSSPKCSAESTRCSRVSQRRCRNPVPRRKSAARIPAYQPERILDRISDRVVVSSSRATSSSGCTHRAQIPRPSRLGKRGRSNLGRWIGWSVGLLKSSYGSPYMTGMVTLPLILFMEGSPTIHQLSGQHISNENVNRHILR